MEYLNIKTKMPTSLIKYFIIMPQIKDLNTEESVNNNFTDVNYVTRDGRKYNANTLYLLPMDGEGTYKHINYLKMY